ncbi:MAG: hypothetical protein HC866_08420 [Leptolyngbyaceae cyanobacterium RU_5_1]|nr:hypothetical protein [Leptolyngbyaceae cyanobacterium RU_5_1]
MTKTMLEPQRISSDQLLAFMKRYLTQRGKQELFDDQKHIEYFERLSQTVTDERNVTVLFVKLYLELIIAPAEGYVADDLPNNVPDLMLSYVNILNQNLKEGKLKDATVQRNAKVVAWECLRQTFKPETAKLETVLDALAALEGGDDTAKKTAEQHLNYLEDRLSLIRTKSANQRLDFALAPLAEYLAGLYRVETFGNDEASWQGFLAEAREKLGNQEDIHGFLLAVRDCCIARAKELRISASRNNYSRSFQLESSLAILGNA